METLLTHIHHSLSGLTATDVMVGSGAVVAAAQYGFNNIFNLKERRFLKAFLGYVVTPGIITVAVALFHAYPDFFAHYPEVALLGQGFYYTVEAIIAVAQKNTPDPTGAVGTAAVTTSAPAEY